MAERFILKVPSAEAFRRGVADVLGRDLEDVQLHDALDADHGIDSLQAYEIWLYVVEEYGVELPETALGEGGTVAEVYRTLTATITQQATHT
jgi:acyl carrier protein